MPVLKKRKFDKHQMRLETRIMPNTLNDEKRTVEVVWSKGTKGLRRTYFGDYYEELSMDRNHVDLSRLNSSAPLLASHDAYSLESVIGVVERAWIDESGEGKAIVRFAKDEFSDNVYQKVRDGILKNISVGYDVDNYEDVTQEGEEIPTFRATKWEPMEISVVPIGFDKHAQIRSKDKNEDSVKMITISNHREVSNMDEVEKQKLEEKARQEREAAVAAERTRCQEIRKLVKDSGLDIGLADEYIERNVTVDQAKTNLELFKKYSQEQAAARVIATQTHVEVGNDNAVQKREGMVEMLLNRVDGKNFQVTERAKQFAGKSLIRALEQYIGRGPHESDYEFAKRTMTTSDLPLILANVAEKSAQKRYELTPKSSSVWTSRGSLRNYKEHSQVRGGDFGNLQKRNENGEYQEASFSEEQEKAQLEKYGVIHSFSDEMIVNDDLALILQIAGESGRAVARLENQLAYGVLTGNPAMADGDALFHANHGNLGTTGAIGETTFKEAFMDMRNQTSVDGRDVLNIPPRYLIVGPELEVAGKKFLATNLNPVDPSDVNPFAGSLMLIVDAEISDDKYFFACDQNLIDTVKIFGLEGQSGPKVESRVKWETDAIQLKVSHSIEVAPMDWRGLYKNKAT